MMTRSRRRTKERLSTAVFRARIEAGLTQKQLADAARVSDTTIWNLENDTYDRPQPAKLTRVLRVLSLNPDDFIELRRKAS